MAEKSKDHQSALTKFRAEHDLYRAEAPHVARAIAASGHWPTIPATLADAENKIADLDARIEAQRPPANKASTEEIQDYALKLVLDLKSLLRDFGTTSGRRTR